MRRDSSKREWVGVAFESSRVGWRAAGRQTKANGRMMMSSGNHRRRRRRHRRGIGIGIGIVVAVTAAVLTSVVPPIGGGGVGLGLGRRGRGRALVGDAGFLVRGAALGVVTVGGWMVTAAPAAAVVVDGDWEDGDEDDGALFDDGFFDEDVEDEDEDEDEDGVSTASVGETVETRGGRRTSGSGSDAWDAVEAVGVDEGNDDDWSRARDARDGDAVVDDEGGGKKSVLEDLVELGGTQARALLRDLFVEASKFGIDMDGDDDGLDEGDDDDDDDEFQEEEDAETLALAAQAEAAYAASTELHAVEYDEEEDDSENERAIEQRKKLLLGLGVDVDSEPVPAVVEETTRESNEPEPEPEVVVAAKSVEGVKAKVRVDPAKVVEPTRGRSLLSVSDPESYKWLTWDDLPAKIRNRVEAPAQEQADVRVVRVGGYWRAASVNNRQRRKSKSRNGFPLRKSEQDDTPLKECNQRHSVSHIQCFGGDSRYAIITVDAKHSFLPGDYVTFERIDAQNAMHARDINRQYRVWALPAKADADVSKLNWDNIWAASPLATSRQSVFAVAFDTPGISCDAYPGMNSIVRRSANQRLPYC